MTDIVELARAQLVAYNSADLDAFVACYHPDIRVFSGDKEDLRGRLAFREKYRVLFSEWTFGATVSERVALNRHCVDFEEWWRINPETGERSEGQILVRYEERDGLIGTAQFLR